MHIAQAAPPAFGDQQARLMRQQLADELFGIGIGHPCTHGHPDLQIAAVAAGHLFAHAVLATFRLKATPMTEIHQGIQSFVGYQIDTATLTAVTAIRTAARDVFFTPEAGGTIAAISRVYLDDDLVDEFHRLSRETGPSAITRATPQTKSPVCQRRGLPDSIGSGRGIRPERRSRTGGC